MFETASGGTVFLDEVVELSVALQAKLLRVLESGEYVPIGKSLPDRSSARVISATNRDLSAESEAGTFRRDLYARLAVAWINLPPLRHRRADIIPLFEHFLARQSSDPVSFSPAFVEALLLHPWPLNVRELRATAQRARLLGVDALRREHLADILMPASPPLSSRASAPAKPAKHNTATRPSRAELVAMLREHKGNVDKTAMAVGKAPRQIRRWMKSYDLDPNDFRSGR